MLPSPHRWLTAHSPASAPALPLITDLGPGETEVMRLVLELEDSIVILKLTCGYEAQRNNGRCSALLDTKVLFGGIVFGATGGKTAKALALWTAIVIDLATAEVFL